MLAHGGTAWGPVQEAVPGDSGYLARRRDFMLEAGLLVNLSHGGFGERFGGGFSLWHRDDPKNPGGEG